MWVKHGFDDIELERPSGVTIGAFDGVHRGHRALIHQLVTEAQRRALRPVVLTFDPLPRQVADRGEAGLLTTLEERLARIAALDVGGVVVLPFDDELMNTPAATFVHQMVDHLALHGLWVGPDFKLGRDREGDVEFLQQAGARHGFEVQVLHETVMWQGRPVRSSRIRRAIREGRIREANGCLGYPYHLAGTIGHGEQRGRELGFPTANLEVPQDRLRPATGVYVCRAHLEGGVHDAITNVGTRPTFNDYPLSVEAYLLDYSGDLYGAWMRLDFLAYLRPEERFSSVEALIAQMRRDETLARAWLAGEITSLI